MNAADPNVKKAFEAFSAVFKSSSVAMGSQADTQRVIDLLKKEKGVKGIDEQLAQAYKLGASAAQETGHTGQLDSKKLQEVSQQHRQESLEYRANAADANKSVVKRAGLTSLLVGATVGTLGLAAKAVAATADLAIRAVTLNKVKSSMSAYVNVTSATKWAAGGAGLYKAARVTMENSARQDALEKAHLEGMRAANRARGASVAVQPTVHEAPVAQATPEKAADAAAPATSAVKTAAEVSAGGAAMAAIAASLTKKSEPARTEPEPAAKVTNVGANISNQAAANDDFAHAMHAMREGSSVPAARGTVTEVAPGHIRHTARADAIDANKPKETVANAPEAAPKPSAGDLAMSAMVKAMAGSGISGGENVNTAESGVKKADNRNEVVAGI